MVRGRGQPNEDATACAEWRSAEVEWGYDGTPSCPFTRLDVRDSWIVNLKDRSPSNLYELGANDKIVQRVLRHAKPHVTRERYIKAFDPAVMEAMQRMQVVVNSLQAWPAVGQQTN